MPDGTQPGVATADAEVGSGMFPAPLLIWLSPAFPVGGFAFSHGLEWAAEKGWIKDRATLETWLIDLIELGSAHNDMTLLAAAWRAIASGDDAALAQVCELAVALQPSAERHLETVTQGGAFIAQIEASWPCNGMTSLRRAWPGEITYSVAVGVAAASHRVALGHTLEGYALAFLGNLISAAVRLGFIGQTDGQKTLAALVGRAQQAARRSAASTLDDLGGACWRSDLASVQHETQYTRLFRS
jgi:urease accessory protein